MHRIRTTVIKNMPKEPPPRHKEYQVSASVSWSLKIAQTLALFKANSTDAIKFRMLCSKSATNDHSVLQVRSERN